VTQFRIGVVVVSHNSESFLSETLDSIGSQTIRPTVVLVVDDHSVDGTVSTVGRWSASRQSAGIAVSVVQSMCIDQHPYTRIARNFTQGVRALRDLDLIALADHDDEWLPDRLEVQSGIMHDADSMFLASNGVLSGSTGTLFETFEVPDDFGAWNRRRQLRHVLRRSVATGGASMLRPGALMRSRSFIPPPGWLHDRWWSIVAAVHGRLQVSKEPVLRYQLSPSQMVGLNRGRQSLQGFRRLGSINRSDLTRLHTLHSLKEEAPPELQAEFRWDRLVKALL